MPYLSITENGSGRIIFSKTDASILGLCISNLSTCTGIVIIGNEGMAVVHDESFLMIESLEQEFGFIGELREWFVFYNPRYLKDAALRSRQQAMALISEKYPGGDFRETHTGKVIVFRESAVIEINFDDVSLVPPKEYSQRKAIRCLNNLGASSESYGKDKTCRVVPVDVQFDGECQTSLPGLIWSYEHLNGCISEMSSWRDKESMLYTEECRGYLSTIFSGQKSSSTTAGFFKSPSASDKFNELQKKFKGDDDDILLQLIQLATTVAAEWATAGSSSGEFECYAEAEHYHNMAKKYLKQALVSANEATVRAARALRDEALGDDEESDASAKAGAGSSARATSPSH